MAAGIILEDVTINQPVADSTARNAIPTGSLVAGCVVFQLDAKTWYSWSGSAWEASPDMQGPAVSVDGYIPQYDGTTGKLLKGGIEPITTNLNDIDPTPATDGQILKWNAGSAKYIPSNESGNGDVVGPGVSISGTVPTFSDTTGKLLADSAKTFGIADTNIVTIDSGVIAIGEYARFTANGLESVDIPGVTTDSALYTVLVKSSGGDYTSLATALAAGHDRVIVDASLGAITETSEITFSKNVSVFLIGELILQAPINFNNTANTKIIFSSFQQQTGTLNINFSTQIGALKNQNQSSVRFVDIQIRNSCYDTTLGTPPLEGAGVISPSVNAYVENVSQLLPNSIRNGFDFSGCVASNPCFVKNLDILGGGAACGAAFVPGPNMTGEAITFRGGYFKSPSDTDSINNKHAIMWNDEFSPIKYNISDIKLQFGTTNTEYSMVVSGNIDGVSHINTSPVNINLIGIGDNSSLTNIDFGNYLAGGTRQGGYFNAYINCNNLIFKNCINIGALEEKDPLTDKLDNKFFYCYFSDLITNYSKSASFICCDFFDSVSASYDDVKFTNCNIGDSMGTSGAARVGITQCNVGYRGAGSITAEAGSIYTTIIGCYTRSAITNNATDTMDVGNQVVA